MTRGRVLRGAVLLLVWLVISAVAGLALFLNSSRSVVLASHDATLRPTLDGYVVLRTGPVLPDFRFDSGGVVGLEVALSKTTAQTTEELVERYAYIASQPQGQIAKARDSVAGMAVEAGLRGGVIGLVPVVAWLLVGAERRGQLARRARGPRGVAAATALVAVGVLVVQPWSAGDDAGRDDEWTTLSAYLGDDVAVPHEVADVEVSTDVTSFGTRRLVQSALDTYDQSRLFYDDAALRASGLRDVREPEAGDTVVALLSDRHLNIGMDRVARAIADQGGATGVMDAGDDTSTGQRWEAFSLDSVTTAFEDLDRWAIAGNHDHGSFVGNYMQELGWTRLEGQVVEGPGDTTLLGLDDPRSSGLGNWRDETGLSFTEVGTRLSDVACESEERVTTILVHDANLAAQALARGCTDLVLGGHTHVAAGPVRVAGENGEVGYSYTTGTTGGAAYAIAVGSKPRREATVALVTYREGRPAGIQSVVLQTNGEFEVGPWIELVY
jgi:predicted phosphodiesterase